MIITREEPDLNSMGTEYHGTHGKRPEKLSRYVRGSGFTPSSGRHRSGATLKDTVHKSPEAKFAPGVHKYTKGSAFSLDGKADTEHDGVISKAPLMVDGGHHTKGEEKTSTFKNEEKKTRYQGACRRCLEGPHN